MEARCGGPAQRLTSILLRKRMSGAYVVMPAPGDEASLRADVAGIHAFLTAKKTWMAGGRPDV